MYDDFHNSNPKTVKSLVDEQGNIFYSAKDTFGTYVPKINDSSNQVSNHNCKPWFDVNCKAAQVFSI